MFCGTVYIFKWNGEAWIEETQFSPEDVAGSDNFGRDMDVDGSNVIVGAWLDDSAGKNAGSAYIFDISSCLPDTGPSAGDLDSDGDIDGADLGLLLGNWGNCPPEDECIADLSKDGNVDPADLAILLANWG